jgi:hypothetical protein
MAVIANGLCVLKKLSDTFLSALIVFLSQKRNELLPYQLARCYHLFAASVSAAHHKQIYIPLLRSCHPLSPEACFIYLSISWSNPEDVFQTDSPHLAGEFMHRRIPSFFCAGLRLFDRALSCLSEKRLPRLLKHGFPLLIRYFPRFMNLFPIAETAGTAWIAILSNPALKQFCSVLLSNAPRLIPSNADAAFSAISLCIPQIVQFVIGQKQYVDVSKQLLDQMDALLTSPPSILLAKIYVKTLAIRLERVPPDERGTQALSLFQDWVMNRLEESDSYVISDLIFDWCVTVLRVHAQADWTCLTCGLFHRAPRFFPVFVALSKFVRTRFYDQKPEARPHLRDIFIAAAQSIPCRAHATAMRHLLDARIDKPLLDLASFGSDCPESDALAALFDGRN